MPRRQLLLALGSALLWGCGLLQPAVEPSGRQPLRVGPEFHGVKLCLGSSHGADDREPAEPVLVAKLQRLFRGAGLDVVTMPSSHALDFAACRMEGADLALWVSGVGRTELTGEISVYLLTPEESWFHIKAEHTPVARKHWGQAVVSDAEFDRGIETIADRLARQFLGSQQTSRQILAFRAHEQALADWDLPSLEPAPAAVPVCFERLSWTHETERLRPLVETVALEAGYDVTCNTDAPFHQVELRWDAPGFELRLYDRGEDLLESQRGKLVAPKGVAVAEVERALAVEVCNGLSRSRQLGRFAQQWKPRPEVLAMPQRSASALAAGAKLPDRTKFLSATPQPAAYALVIGIENYRDVVAALGAKQDADAVAKLLRETFGVPEQNLRIALDHRATRGDIDKHLDWLVRSARAGSRIYLFFGGHGAPDPGKGTSYLLPFDGDPKYLERTALAVSDVIDRLGKSRAKEVLVLLDSCFSGTGGRSVLASGTRPLVIQWTTVGKTKVAVLAAASGAETSGPGPQGGGLFTHYLLEALGRAKADTDGDSQVSLAELHEFLKIRVARAAKRDGREQTPDLRLPDGWSARDFPVLWGVSASQ